MQKIMHPIKLLEMSGELPMEYKPHKLFGNRNGQWECHIQPDWLMVWEQDDNQLTLLFIQTGTHSDLF
jgi:mRNA interferase YafQ